MSKRLTIARNHIGGRTIQKMGAARLAKDATVTHVDLQNLGFNFMAMDSRLIGPAVSGQGIDPYFLQTWLSGAIRTMTAPVTIDNIVGITAIGNWSDDIINQRVIDVAGHAEDYTDDGNIPFADISKGVESRTVVRKEQGFQVGQLEEILDTVAGFASQAEKRRAVQLILDNTRNKIGFYGDGDGTYGLLNDPSLANVVSRIGAHQWNDVSDLTYDDLVADFNAMVGDIEDRMGQGVPDDAELCFVIPTGYRHIWTRSNAVAQTFRDYVVETFPNLRVVTSEEMKDGIGSGEDAAYLIYENAAGANDSDVGGSTIIQLIPARYHVLGNEQTIKGFVEDAVMATAGTFIQRPWAVSRMKIKG